MFKLYNKSESIVLPNGKSYTGEQLGQLGGYDVLLNVPCAIDVSGGIMTSYQTLGSLANQYSVSDQGTPEEIMSAINAAIEKRKHLSSTQNSIQRAAQIVALTFTDEQAIEVPDLYPEFEFDHEYRQNDRFQYDGKLYKVNQDHTSQEQWVPGTEGTESLYTNLMLNDAGHQIWKQPTGAHDAYNTGDVVEYKGTLYKSLIDGNVWAPDAYPQGWQEYSEE